MVSTLSVSTLVLQIGMVILVIDIEAAVGLVQAEDHLYFSSALIYSDRLRARGIPCGKAIIVDFQYLGTLVSLENIYRIFALFFVVGLHADCKFVLIPADLLLVERDGDRLSFDSLI